MRLAHWVEGAELITVKGCVGVELTRDMIEGATHIYVRSAITDVPKGAMAWETEEDGVRVG